LFGLFRKKKIEESPVDQVATTVPTPDKEAWERIVPVIKVVEHESPDMEHVDLPADESPVCNPFAADLIVMYAEDFPDRFAYLSKRRMRELGLTMDELHSLAVANLPNRVQKIELHGSAPRFMITAGGNFEATLLLHPTLWDDLSEHIPGSPMAVAPARDLLFVTSSEWEEGISFLREMAEKELEDKRYSLSKCLLVRRNGGWVADALHS